MLTTFDRYLIKRYVHVFVVLFISAYGLFVVIDGFSNIDAYQQDAADHMQVMQAMGRYYGYQISVFFELVGPILSVISVMAVLALMTRHSEIKPILAAGIPTYRLAMPFLMGTVVVNAALIANQEYVFPRISEHLMARSAEEAAGSLVEPTYDYRTRVHLDGTALFLDQHRMTKPAFVLPVPDITDELVTLRAEEAFFLEASESRPAGWLLRNSKQTVEELKLTEKGRKVILPTTTAGEFYVVTDVSFDQLYQRNKSYKYLTTGELIRRIRNPSFGLISVRAQTMHLHERLTRPVSGLLAVFIVVPLVIRRESRSIILNMAVCAVVLTLIFAAQQAFAYLGGKAMISPSLAVWIPLMITGALAAWMSGRVLT